MIRPPPYCNIIIISLKYFKSNLEWMLDKRGIFCKNNLISSSSHLQQHLTWENGQKIAVYVCGPHNEEWHGWACWGRRPGVCTKPILRRCLRVLTSIVCYPITVSCGVLNPVKWAPEWNNRRIKCQTGVCSAPISWLDLSARLLNAVVLFPPNSNIASKQR